MAHGERLIMDKLQLGKNDLYVGSWVWAAWASATLRVIRPMTTWLSTYCARRKRFS